MKLVYFLFRCFIFRLGFRSGFTHTKTTKCELALLKQHILLNVFAHINLFPTSTKCRQIESPKRFNDSTTKHRLFGLRPHEVWRRLGIVQTSLTLLSACTNFHRLVDSSIKNRLTASPNRRITKSPNHHSFNILYT